ncbi:hypothetical protein P7C70_g3334, partial [Phenoliferia sp. Uapishka_3]
MNSWVAGAETIALIELDYPTLSVFSPSYYTSIKPNITVPVSSNSIIAGWAAIRPSGATQLAEVTGGASGDPASLGVGWILAALTEGDLSQKLEYLSNIMQEVSFQLNTVPRTSDGAISMRGPGETVSLWADFVSQVPPTLAFYGAVMNRPSVLLEAYTQCSLYRKYLRDPTSGLWQHIMFGTDADSGFWGTGNAWAASGMARVLATMQNGPTASNYTSQIADLASWTNEILTAAFSQINTSSNLLPNYYDSTSTFDDASSSALLAATAFRMATLGYVSQSSTTFSTAEKIREAVNAAIDETTGWIASVVDPLNWDEQGYESPEAEAFAMMVNAAWRDYWATQ